MTPSHYLTVPVIPTRGNSFPQAERPPVAFITVIRLKEPPHSVALVSWSVSPSPFPPPSGAFTSKPRKQEIVHSAAISTAKKGVVDHSLLSRAMQTRTPGTREIARAATSRSAMLVPIKPSIGDGQRTPSPDVTMRVVDPGHVVMRT